MKTKLITATALFAGAILMILGIFLFCAKDRDTHERAAEQIVALNEIEQLAAAAAAPKQQDVILQKVTQLQESLREAETEDDIMPERILAAGMTVLSLVFLLLVFAYIYYAVLKPFEKMKAYAGKLAQGNFDVPLDYERSNYFGDFTWAFDHMRREIRKARACEREAIDNNKTVIATLSHDIKAPISSIRAYAEGLEANLNGTVEKRSRYLQVIMKKCDEVSRLTNDLFLHSLSDLDKLIIISEPVEINAFIGQVLEELEAEQEDIRFTSICEQMTVLIDKNRFAQVIENLIQNARKYAGTQIHIALEKQNGGICIRVRDYGAGIPDADIPFIFDKFYRGANCGREPGSGLGLYIVKYVMEQMNGTIGLKNCGDGLEAALYVPELKP